MEAVITAIMPYVPSNAVALVAVAIVYIIIQAKRKETKTERDADANEIHDKLLKHDFEINNMKGTVGHHDDILEDLREQVNLLNVNIVKLTVSLKNLVNNLEKK